MRLALAALALLIAPAYAQDNYHINFTRIFASPEAEKADRAALRRDLDALEAMRGSLTRDGDHLFRALQLRDAIQTRLGRHAMYLYLRYAVDTRDERSRDEGDALDSEVNARTAFVNDALTRLPAARVTGLMKAEPKLELFRYAIESVRRFAPHTLSEPEEKMLSLSAPKAINWQFDLYQRLTPGTQRADGEEAFRKRWATFASRRDLFAFALTRLAASRNAFAKLRHFDDDVAQSYFRMELTRSGVKSLLDRVAENAGVYKRYQQLRADQAKATNVWDVVASSTVQPRFTIDQARAHLLAAAAPLGDDYVRELRALLDPANGRMDILPGPNRKSGGFSQGSIGTDSGFFANGFTGTYDNMRVLAHEATHAVQRQLMTANHVPIVYANGPHYLAEALAIFNELVLADFMAAHASTSAEKQFYLEQFLDGKGMVAFVAAPEAELEEAVYDGVNAGTIRGADDLDALTRRIYTRYSIWPAKHDELKQQWMAVPLMYEDPFYDLNYVYGGIIALRMYAMYTSDSKAFAPRYVAMMRNGYTAPAATLLEKFFDIDLSDPRLLTDVVKLLDARVDALSAEFTRD